jgi:hypothetical protein
MVLRDPLLRHIRSGQYLYKNALRSAPMVNLPYGLPELTLEVVYDSWPVQLRRVSEVFIVQSDDSEIDDQRRGVTRG